MGKDGPKRWTRIKQLLEARRLQARIYRRCIAKLQREKEQRDKQIERQARAILKELHG